MWISSYDLRPQSLYTHQEILTTDIEESAVSVLRTLSGAKRLSTLSACDFPRYSAVSIIDLVTEMSKSIMVSKSVSLLLSPVLLYRLQYGAQIVTGKSAFRVAVECLVKYHHSV